MVKYSICLSLIYLIDISKLLLYWTHQTFILSPQMYHGVPFGHHYYICFFQVREKLNRKPRTLIEETSGMQASFKNKGGWLEMSDFKEINNENVFCGVNLMFQ